MATGRYNKRNHDIMPYEKMVELGYKPLVRRYWEMREDPHDGDRDDLSSESTIIHAD